MSDLMLIKRPVANQAIYVADDQVQEEPFFITEEIKAEMIAAGYVFQPPTHFTTTNARRLFDLREGETVSEAIARHSAKFPAE